MNDDLDFGQAVRIALAKRNVTRQELADRLGSHRSKIDDMCRKKEKGNLVTVKAVAKALDMNVSELIAFGEGE